MLPKPNVIVSSSDYERLHAYLDGLPDSSAVDRLIDELERAEVVDTDKMPDNVVIMNSTVTFTILSSQKTCTYTLVFPHEATSAGALSVLTPVGSALLGLSVGQEIEWPVDGNKTTRVRIDAIPN